MRARAGVGASAATAAATVGRPAASPAAKHHEREGIAGPAHWFKVCGESAQVEASAPNRVVCVHLAGFVAAAPPAEPAWRTGRRESESIVRGGVYLSMLRAKAKRVEQILLERRGVKIDAKLYVSLWGLFWRVVCEQPQLCRRRSRWSQVLRRGGAVARDCDPEQQRKAGNSNKQ